MLRIAVISSVFLGFASSFAFAQSAEQTVSFILFGLEDGVKLTGRDGAIIQVEQTGKDPLTYSVIKSDGSDITANKISIRQAEQCKFEVIESQSKVRTVYDFNAVTDVTYTAGLGLLHFTGRCPIKGSDGSCNPTKLISHEIPTPPKRIAKALSFLRSEYCSGSAF